MKTYMNLALLGGALALASAPAFAVVDTYLATKAYTKTMPDGSTVPMWGYVVDVDNDADNVGDCWQATGGANGRLACVNALPDPVSPGPRLTAGATDPNFRIYLTNGLPEPTSIVITGQQLPWSSNNQNVAGPVWDDGSHGPRGNDLTKKVRSFGSEANPDGGRRVYVWNNNRATPFVKPGSFVYHSGTHPQKQVYMGLYGAVTKDAVAADTVAGTPAVAYIDPADGVTPLASTTYDQEVVLFYSDIDPVINNAINDGSYTTSVDMNAQWFLINGEPYDPANKANPAMTIPAAAAGSPTLVRFFSAASETHVPTLQGLYMDIHAEDGLVYNYQDGTGAHAVPRTQFSVSLPPLKTKDAIIVPQLGGTYAVYDGNGYMTNPSDINDFNVGDTVGGMLRFLSVGAGTNQLPAAVGDTATTDEDVAVIVDVLANDSDADGDTLTVTGVGTPGNGSAVVNGDNTVTYTPDPDFNGSDAFTYNISDGNGGTATATVDVTVNAVNDAPIAGGDAYITDQDTALNEATPGVLGNDTDVDGDPLTAVLVADVTNGTLVLNADGSFIYTPTAGFTGSDSFTYAANDGTVDSNAATVTITVGLVTTNTPPVAVDDAYSSGEDTLLNVAAPGVLGNDTDADGDPLTAVLLTDVTNGTLVLNGDGSFSYTPSAAFTGSDSFTYAANDGTANGNTAMVNITVTPVNDAPVAVDDTIYLNSMVTTMVAAPGVLANDTDPEGDALTALLDQAVEPPPELTAFNANGSFAYTLDIEDGRVGTIGTFTYLANDGQTNSIAPATVTLLRNLSVSQAVCEWEPQQGGRCDWSIQGTKLSAGQVRAYVAGTNTLIGQTGANAGAGAWTITSNNNTQVNPAVGTSIAIDVRMDGNNPDPNAVILGYPTVSQ